MADQNDHDLLIALNTKMEMVLKFMSDYNSQMVGLIGRVSALENKDSRDSEKVQTISANVQTSLKNGERITSLEAELKAIHDEVDAVRNKSNTWDIVNSIGIGLGTLIGYIFGK